MKITVHRIYSTLAAMVTVLGVSVSPALAQEPEPATRPAQPASVSFPHAVTGEAGTVVVYTPQIDTWKNFESIEARVAVAVTPAGEEEPVFGVAEFTGHTDPNLELRVVAIENLKVTATSFPISDDARRQHLDAVLRASILRLPVLLPLPVQLRRTGSGVATNRYANESGARGESLVTHNDKWLQTQSQWDGDSRTTEFRTSEGGADRPGKKQCRRARRHDWSES